MTTRFLIGDVRECQAEIPDESVDLVITSPPFYCLRSYLPEGHPDKDKEIGSEPTPAAFLDVLLSLTADWRRVLAPHGSIAIELGDSYSGSGGAGGDYDEDGLRAGQPKFRQQWPQPHGGVAAAGWPLPQSLACIPQLYQVALAYGINPLTGQPSPAGRWRVRNLKPWIRSNPPVGALGRKERPATSYVIVACLATDRYFDLDAVRTPVSGTTATVGRPSVDARRKDKTDGGGSHHGVMADVVASNPAGAPPLDWVHDVDIRIDAVLDQTGWSDENCTCENHDHRGGAGRCAFCDCDLNDDNGLGSAQNLRGRRESQASRWDAVGLDGDDPMARATDPSPVPNPALIEGIIDAEIDRRAGKPGHTGGTGDRSGKETGAARGGQWSTFTGGYDVSSGSVGARGVHIRRALERAGILTTLEALDVSPKGYAGAHYAVWPPELVRLLLAEMCPRRVCTVCGQPSRRIVGEATYMNPRTGNTPTVMMFRDGDRGDKVIGHGVRAPQNFTGDARAVAQRPTLGWSDCGCPEDRGGGEQVALPGGSGPSPFGDLGITHAATSDSFPTPKWRPAHILDPFAGSGTTLAVASGMGHDSTGIDIDERNSLLALERVGMFLEIEERDTIQEAG